MRTGRVRVPQVRDIETALRLYYERLELSNKDIKELFETSTGTVYRLKGSFTRLTEADHTASQTQTGSRM